MAKSDRNQAERARRRPRRPHARLAVRRGAHGLGIFATAPIKKGAFIIEYWGDLITEDEANRRGGKYLFELEGEMAIDGKTRANAARYINHSCRPNCEPIEQVRAKRVFIFARRNIKEGEELGYDYGKEYWEDHIKPLVCRCGCGGKGPKRW